MSELVKISFPLTGDNARNGFEVERLWAKVRENDVYTLDNSPFQVYGVSLGDSVSAHLSKGELIYRDVVERGGHSTYRIRLPTGKGHDYFLRYWKNLGECGCGYEGARGDQRLYAIDVPSVSLVDTVYRILQENENLSIWEFEEAHYAGNN